MKYTLLLTQRCNLACGYCYIGQRRARMPLEVAARIVDFAYRNTPSDERIEVGFFGGEPLTEFDLLQRVTNLFEAHSEFDPGRVQFTVVTNGTVFSSKIARFAEAHNMGFGISCDGPPEVHDVFRRFHSGRGSSAVVERTIRRALEAFSAVMVNSVYGPTTIERLPDTVAYLSSLGVRQIYVNPDFTGDWGPAHIEQLPDVYRQIGQQYIDYCQAGDPHFISLIDSKIAVILRQGYHPLERCRMACGEFSFTPEGAIYPCERLVGDGLNGHRVGHVDTGVDIGRLGSHRIQGEPLNRECLDCDLRDYCMNWCGCSNYFASGYYNRVSPFICASEKAAIQVALDVFQTLESRQGGLFVEHLSGAPLLNSLLAGAGSPS